MASNHLGRNSVGSRGARAPNYQPAPSPDVERPATARPHEVVLEGRRYRLVPLDETSTGGRGSSVASLLTGRELQIIVLVAAGRVNKQVADELHISEWTVSTHLRRIFAKLGVDTRAAMVSRCADLLATRKS